MTSTFLAKYNQNGITRTVVFNREKYSKEDAEKWLNAHDIKNFFFFFEPIPPQPFDDETMLFRGEVGFDITADSIMEQVNAGKNIIIDSGGGSHFEGLKIYDSIKLSGKNPTIGVIGVCASAAFDILMAGEKRWVSENSRGLIHNPWTFAEGDDAAFFAIANDLKTEKEQLANLYSKITGQEVETLLRLMAEERFMTPDEMLNLGFIHEIKTFTKPKIDNEMTEKEKELTEKVGKMEAFVNGLKNLFAGKPEIKALTVQDANGIEIDFPDIEEESQIAVGIAATVDGAPASGSYVVGTGMHEGKTLVFENGSLVEIIEPETNEEMEALKAENSALKEQLEVANKTLKDFKAKAEKDIKALSAQVSEFKSMVTGGDEPTNQDPPAEPPTSKKGFTYKKKK